MYGRRAVFGCRTRPTGGMHEHGSHLCHNLHSARFRGNPFFARPDRTTGSEKVREGDYASLMPPSPGRRCRRAPSWPGNRILTIEDTRMHAFGLFGSLQELERGAPFTGSYSAPERSSRNGFHPSRPEGQDGASRAIADIPTPRGVARADFAPASNAASQQRDSCKRPCDAALRHQRDSTSS